LTVFIDITFGFFIRLKIPTKLTQLADTEVTRQTLIVTIIADTAAALLKAA